MFSSVGNGTQKTIYIASDHAGFELKNYLVDNLKTGAYSIHNLGPNTYDVDDDYPDYAKKVAEAVSMVQDHVVGILICRSGVGVSILANKYNNVRCSLSWNPEHARAARNDDNVNCLALPAGYISKETALETVTAFLETPFSNEERHIRRLAKYGNTGNL